MFRKTLVTLIALALVVSPVHVFAKDTSLFLTDVKEGGFGTVFASGTPGAAMSVVLVSPAGERTSLSLTAGNDGKASKKFDAPSDPGKYSAYISGRKDETMTNFTVLSLRNPSSDASSLSLSSKRGFADGEDLVRVTVSIRDEDGMAMSGREISLEANDRSATISPVTVLTDESGEGQFAVRTQTPGNLTLIAKDSVTGKALAASKVEFLAVQNDAPAYVPSMAGYPQMPYYAYPQYPMYPAYPSYAPMAQDPSSDLSALQQKLQDLEYQLRSVDAKTTGRGGDYLSASILDVNRAYGQSVVDHFEFVDLDKTPIKVGEPASFTVRALDASGAVVENYTGTVTFTSSDTDTLLPSDYTFEAADLGEHEFTLALTVLNDAPQKLTVADTSDQDIKGEADIAPGMASTGAKNVVNTIKLASPAAGTYASTLQTISGKTRDNSTVTIYDGSTVLGSVTTDATGNFSYQATGLSEGAHTIKIESEYIPTGEITDSEPVIITIDITPPVITSMTLNPQTPVEEGDAFTVTVVTELEASVAVIINNLSYDLVAQANGTYLGNLVAPLVAAEYPISIVAKDKLGNEGNFPNEATLVVKPKKKPITNVLAIGGEESVQMDWDLFVNAARYRISYGTQASSYNQQIVTLDSAPNWRLENLQGGTVYYMIVEALDATGQVISLPSEETSVRTLERSALGAGIIQPPSGSQVSSTGPELWFVLFGSLIFLDMYVRVRRKLRATI